MTFAILLVFFTLGIAFMLYFLFNCFRESQKKRGRTRY